MSTLVRGGSARRARRGLAVCALLAAAATGAPHVAVGAVDPGSHRAAATSGNPERAHPLAGHTITIDPGHPSEGNLGTAVQNGTTEVHVAWLIALKLGPLLEHAGAWVVMTKSAEREYVTNTARAVTANVAGSSLFLRLHCDTGPGTGFTTYYPDRQGTAHGVRGPGLRVIAASRTAAHAFHEGFARVLRGVLKDNGVRGDSRTYIGRRQGALTGSIFSQVPVVLVEMCFLSNPRDAKFVRSPRGQTWLARALLAGTVEYVSGPAAPR